VWGWSPHSQKWEVGVLRDSQKLELDRKGQISSHSSVFDVIRKVLKCRCPKWPRMSHLDICSPSDGQKKGPESNWQFDSRPLKVGNWPLPEICKRRATWCWKALEESYNFCLDLAPIGCCSQEIWAPKVPGLQPGTISGPPRLPREKGPFGCSLGEELQSILYGGRWWLPSSPGRGESSVSKCSWLAPTLKGVPECELTFLWLVLDADSSEITFVPFPSLIPGLLARPSIPF
jgi:hypothetical protein